MCQVLTGPLKSAHLMSGQQIRSSRHTSVGLPHSVAGGIANATFVGQQLAALIDGAEPQTIACPLTALDTFAFHAYRKLGIVAMSTYYRILDRLEQLSRAPVTN